MGTHPIFESDFDCLTGCVIAKKWTQNGDIERARILLNGTDFSRGMILWQNTEECHRCSWIRSRDEDGSLLPTLEKNSAHVAWVDTRWRQRFRLTLENESNTDYENDGKAVTPFRRLFESGIYSIDLANQSSATKITPIANDKADFKPIWTAAIFSVGAALAFYLIVTYFLKDDWAADPMAKTARRIHSLDVFRGFCVFGMMFVNYGGGLYWFFDHSRWHGLTLADLVMPWFMFVMGIGISFSLSSLSSRNLTKFEVAKKVAIRSFKLLFLGLWIVNVNYAYDTFRIPGVLQRFFISYLTVGMLQVFLT